MQIQSKTIRTFVYLAGLMAALAVGCNRKKDEPTSAPPAEQKTAAPLVKVDEELFKSLKDASSECREVPQQQRINCSGPKKNALVLSFNRGDRKRVASIPTLTKALTDPDPKLQALAAAVLYASFRLGFGAEGNLGAVTTADANGLLEASSKLPSSSAMQAMPAATHAQVLSGNTDAIVSALSNETPLQVRTMAYRYLMVYGRLKVFPRIQELAKDPSTAVVLAAIESPRNMKEWTVDEQTAICPWLVSYLDDKRPPVSGNATAALSNCSGEHVSALLEKIEAALQKGDFGFVHSTSLRDLCRKTTGDTAARASEEQCKRVRTLQEKVVADKKLQVRVRAMTLSAIAQQWPDKQTLQLLKKYEKAKEPELKQAATRSMKRVEDRMKRLNPSPEKKQ